MKIEAIKLVETAKSGGIPNPYIDERIIKIVKAEPNPKFSANKNISHNEHTNAISCIM